MSSGDGYSSSSLVLKQVDNRRKSSLRIALYSHDTMGLGHIRRNLLIAQTLATSYLDPNILLIAGAPEAGAFEMPRGVDCVTVPSLMKDRNGKYHPRSLNLPLVKFVRLRSKLIRKALAEFLPDVLIVDKVPRGALRELEPSLELLRSLGKTCCILGLRDVLDDAATVKREWREEEYDVAIRDYYDAIWVYGDPAVYDPVSAYSFPLEIAEKVWYTGYHDQRMRLRYLNSPEQAQMAKIISGKPYFLCLVGGGQDGLFLADTFARTEFPAGTNGVIITGPFMPSEARSKLHALASVNSNLHVLDFMIEPAPLLKNAERFVTMGGYNTVCDILSFEKPSLIAPRVVPRKEQLIRAERLKELGIVDVLNWENVTPNRIGEWLCKDVECPRVRGRIDMHGLKRIPQLLSFLRDNSILAEA